jgi:hypothetical protein
MSVGKPPKSKKGQSGNPKGPPVSARYLFHKVANEEVAIDVDGDTVMMTRWEALMRQIHIMAFNDLSAARLLHQIRKQFPGDGSPGPKSILVLSDNQMKY